MLEESNAYDIELRLRNFLNTNRIRLCDPPYTVDNNAGEEIDVLASSASDLLGLSFETIRNGLVILREKSINSLTIIEKFKSNRIVTLKVHVPKSKETFTLELSDFESETGMSLSRKISDMIGLALDSIRVIFRGKVVTDSSCTEQGIKNNSKVMVLEIGRPEGQESQKVSQLNKSRNMAEYLSKRVIDGNFRSDSMSMEITNQSGEVLELSNEEKSLLTYGLTMHQQATNFIIEEQYQIAVLHCLEADEAFSRSQYSDKVDNVALLQLDIVWCYYRLQNMDDLADAHRRLDMCERRMRKCYGDGNERIRLIRAVRTFEGVPEAVHMFRLYLLQAVVAYYRGDSAALFLRKAREVYDSVQIPSDLVNQVMLMGFSREEALESLQACSREVATAVEYILRRRRDKNKLQETEKRVSQRREISRRFGRTADKSRLSLDVLERVIGRSDSSPSLCLAAVRQANNDADGALHLLSTEQSRLSCEVERARHQGHVYDGNVSYEAVITERNNVHQLLPLVTVSESVVRKVLRQAGGNIDEALLHLLQPETATTSSNSGSTSSPSEEDTTETEDDSQSCAGSMDDEIENDIFETIGAGASTSMEKRYANNDLATEIEVFNKFANFLQEEAIHIQ